MIALLTHANHQDNLNCLDGKVPIYESKKYQSEVRDLRALYDAILAQAQAENPMVHNTSAQLRLNPVRRPKTGLSSCVKMACSL
jgi:transposase